METFIKVLADYLRQPFWKWDYGKWSVARSCHYFTQINLFYIFRKELLLGTVHERQTKEMSQVASPDSKIDADYQQHQSHVDSQSNDVNLQVCRWLTVFVVM